MFSDKSGKNTLWQREEIKKGLEEMRAGKLIDHDDVVKRWTEGADGNLDQVEEYIAQDSPPAAVAAVNKIIDSAQMLADYPTIGKRGRERGSSLLPVSHTSSFMLYSARS